MGYKLLLLIPFISNMPLLGKCACHETQQLVSAPVKPATEPTAVSINAHEPIPTSQASEKQDSNAPVVAEPIIIPNPHIEPMAQKEVASLAETVPATETVREIERPEDLRTTIQRAAVLCAAIGVVGLILYKATSNSPLERAVSDLEQRVAR